MSRESQQMATRPGSIDAPEVVASYDQENRTLWRRWLFSRWLRAFLKGVGVGFSLDMVPFLVKTLVRPRHRGRGHPAGSVSRLMTRPWMDALAASIVTALQVGGFTSTYHLLAACWSCPLQNTSVETHDTSMQSEAHERNDSREALPVFPDVTRREVGASMALAMASSACLLLESVVHKTPERRRRMYGRRQTLAFYCLTQAIEGVYRTWSSCTLAARRDKDRQVAAGGCVQKGLLGGRHGRLLRTLSFVWSKESVARVAPEAEAHPGLSREPGWPKGSATPPEDQPPKCTAWEDLLVIYLFHVTAWVIMFHWFYYPDALPASYRSWINRLARMPDEPLRYLRRLHHGEVEEGRRGDRGWLANMAMLFYPALHDAASEGDATAPPLEDGRWRARYGRLIQPGTHSTHFDALCQRHGLNPILGDPYHGYMSCQIIHPAHGERCDHHLVSRFFTGYWQVLTTTYLPLHSFIFIIRRVLSFLVRLRRLRHSQRNQDSTEMTVDVSLQGHDTTETMVDASNHGSHQGSGYQVSETVIRATIQDVNRAPIPETIHATIQDVNQMPMPETATSKPKHGTIKQDSTVLDKLYHPKAKTHLTLLYNLWSWIAPIHRHVLLPAHKSSVFIATFLTCIFACICTIRHATYSDAWGPTLASALCGWSVILESPSTRRDMLRFAAPRAMIIMYRQWILKSAEKTPAARRRRRLGHSFEAALLTTSLAVLVTLLRHQPIPDRSNATTLMKVLRWLLLP